MGCTPDSEFRCPDFVAAHESIHGPKPTSRHVRDSVVIGVKADIEPALLFRQQREAAA